MRRLAILVALVGVLYAWQVGGGEGAVIADKFDKARYAAPGSCDGKPATFHSQRAHRILDHAYSLTRWQDPSPFTAQEKRNWQKHRRCLSGPDARLRVSKHRDHLASRFASYRSTRLLTPYPGGGQWWAIPGYVVACESGYSWGAYNAGSQATGPYQMLPSTYGSVCRSCDWSKDDQHYAASRVWARSGGSEWSCA